MHIGNSQLVLAFLSLSRLFAVILMHQSIESPGGGGQDGAEIVHRPSALFCIVPAPPPPPPPEALFFVTNPRPRGTFFKGALKVYIHISLYESTGCCPSFSISDPMRGDFCILPSSCPAPGSHWLRPCFSSGWQRSLPAPSSVLISCITKLLCYPITLTTAGGDDPDSQWRRPWLRGGAIHY